MGDRMFIWDIGKASSNFKWAVLLWFLASVLKTSLKSCLQWTQVRPGLAARMLKNTLFQVSGHFFSCVQVKSRSFLCKAFCSHLAISSLGWKAPSIVNTKNTSLDGCSPYSTPTTSYTASPVTFTTPLHVEHQFVGRKLRGREARQHAQAHRH